MLDSAHLQEEEAERHARRASRRGRAPREALYGALDALNAMGLFGRTAFYGQSLDLVPGVRATFYDAGHILGSSSIRIEETDADRRSIIFSGDLGNTGRPILRDPQVPPPADTVVMETTYGDRRHKEIAPSVEELYDAIKATLKRGGNVIIPTFALERAQEILYYLREGVDGGATAAQPAGVSRLPDGDLSHGDLPASSRVLRRRGQRIIQGGA